jgi:hypothetical protein
MEYSAVLEGYPYVCIRIVHGTRKMCTQCTVRGWPGVGAGNCSQRCRIRYWNKRYFTINNNTLLHLGIRLGRISRLSRTVPVLYVTQRKKTTTGITIGWAPLSQCLGANYCKKRDDRRRINGSGPKKRVRAHCESTIVVTVLA